MQQTKVSHAQFYPDAGMSPRHFSMESNTATLAAPALNLVSQANQVSYKRNRRGFGPQDEDSVMQDRSNLITHNIHSEGQQLLSRPQFHHQNQVMMVSPGPVFRQ